MVSKIIVAHGGAVPCIPCLTLEAAKAAVLEVLKSKGLDRRRKPSIDDISWVVGEPSFVCLADDGELVGAETVRLVSSETPKAGERLYIVLDEEDECKVACTSDAVAKKYIQGHPYGKFTIVSALMII